MPSKNRIKLYAPNSYYHVYNRGVAKQDVFKNNYDFAVFCNLLKRHISNEVVKDKYGRQYDNLSDQIELRAFCLMDNHFHLLLYQKDNDRAIELLMRKVITAYSMYFNKKYKRVGPVFQDRYKASLITDDSYLLHITRYIHLNPIDYKKYEWSSYSNYIGKKHSEWVMAEPILGLFDNDADEYIKFVDDYQDYEETLDITESLLAK